MFCLSPKLSFSFSFSELFNRTITKERTDEVGSSRMMLVGKAKSEYEFIIVLDRLDDQFTVFELIVQDDSLPIFFGGFRVSTSTLCRVLCLHWGVVKKDIGSLPLPKGWKRSGSLPLLKGWKEERFSAGERRFSAFAERLEGRAVLCRRKRLPLPKARDTIMVRYIGVSKKVISRTPVEIKI
ncbi:hypothetical protein M5K25_027679 [Dendrobium thyrsiflorum]|uniref:Uncharacterized protein n=1 Tax=Dendrobium thyrsiflorum TaxID=117978 RepID=A0ABD0TUE3_DENTH